MNTAKIIVNIVAFIVFMLMIILGQRNVGWTGLGVEIVGLIGLLTQLFLYNKKYK